MGQEREKWLVRRKPANTFEELKLLQIICFLTLPAVAQPKAVQVQGVHGFHPLFPNPSMPSMWHTGGEAPKLKAWKVRMLSLSGLPTPNNPWAIPWQRRHGKNISQVGDGGEPVLALTGSTQDPTPYQWERDSTHHTSAISKATTSFKWNLLTCTYTLKEFQHKIHWYKG